MIPQRLPMPGGGSKVAASVAKAAPVVPPAPPPSDPPEADDLIGGQPQSVPPATAGAVVDPSIPFTPPPRPRTAATPGARIAFSATTVEQMIRLLESASAPKVTFSEDVAAMRAEVQQVRAEAMAKVLQALRSPS